MCVICVTHDGDAGANSSLFFKLCMMIDESEIGKKNAGNSRDFVFKFNTLTLIRSLQNVNQFNFDPLPVEI